METYKLIRILKLKEPERRFLILFLTDGKANVSLSGKAPFEELPNICLMLKEFSSTDFIVIDTEKKDKFMKMDLAFKIAEWLEAKYFLMEEIKSENLYQIINSFNIMNNILNSN